MEERRIAAVPLTLLLVAVILQSVTGQTTPCAGTGDHIVGPQAPGGYIASTDTGAGQAYRMEGLNLQSPCCGGLKGVHVTPAIDGDLKIHVWRSDELIWEGDLTGLTGGMGFGESYGDSAQMTVQKGDMFGWYSTGEPIIPYGPKAATDTNIEVKKQTTTPTVGGTTSWAGGALTNIRYAINFEVVPSSAPFFTNLNDAATPLELKVSQAVDVDVFSPEADDINPEDKASLTIEIDGTDDYFKLVGGNVQAKKTLDPGTYSVDLIVKDQCETATTGTLYINVIDDIPEITSLPLAGPLVPEHTKTRDCTLHQLEYTDDQPLNEITCRMDMVPPGPFTLHYDELTSEYVICYDASAKLDFDTANFYNCSVTCNDGTSDSKTKLFEIHIDKNEDPVFTSDATFDVDAEDIDKGGIPVHTLVATDVDGDTPLTFSGTCDGPFEVHSNGEIVSTQPLTHYLIKTHTCSVAVSDTYNTVTQDITVNIENTNRAPNVTNPSEDINQITTEKVKENTGANYDVFQVECEDLDGDDLKFKVEWETNHGNDVFTFDTDNGKIRSREDLDYEKLINQYHTTTFTAQVSCYDGRAWSQKKTINIQVTNENEKPFFDGDKNYFIEEEEGAAFVTLTCAMLTCGDPDGDKKLSYTIDCPNGIYHIDGTDNACEANIKMTAEHDLDDPGAVYEDTECAVTCTDPGGLSDDTGRLTIRTHEIDDHPPDFQKDQFTIDTTNATDAFARIGHVGTVDDDDFQAKHRAKHYTTDSPDFKVDENGNVYPTKDLHYHAGDTFSFEVTVTDDAGHEDTLPVTVNVHEYIITTTTTTTTTTLPPVYQALTGMFDDTGNLIWIIAAGILSAVLLGLLSYMLFRCCTTPGLCSGTRGCLGAGRNRRVGANNYARNQPPPRSYPPRRAITDGRPQQPPQQKPQQPAQKRSMFDCFKKKPAPPKAPKDPENPGHQPFDLWNKNSQETGWQG